MERNQTICLLNDSFPPVIDGVANVVKNYADVLSGWGKSPVVITPNNPENEDGKLSYPVIRYASMDMRKMTGYMAGVPFSPETVRQLEGRKVSILHSHCPIMSTVLGRELRQVVDAPLVMTYHTKFDIDIANIMRSELLRSGSKRALVANINACDEVWTVSEGAGENLRSLGYEGEWIVMPNGVDLPRGRVPDEAIQMVVKDFDLPQGVPVYLFVGRMMWYKGLKIILDAMARLKESGMSFRMVFVGAGGDFDEVRAYSEKLGLNDCVFFAGPVLDREILRAWYCRADLFLFPSTFDTNGLVVREAAACGLGAVLIRGSCAAEGITDGRNGILIEENAQSLCACLQKLDGNIPAMTVIGENAEKEIYLSWEAAVKMASERYEIVIDRYHSGGYPVCRKPLEEVLKARGELMEDLAHLHDLRLRLREQLHEAWVNSN